MGGLGIWVIWMLVCCLRGATAAEITIDVSTDFSVANTTAWQVCVFVVLLLVRCAVRDFIVMSPVCLLGLVNTEWVRR